MVEKLVFATNNQNKLAEIRQILEDKIEVLSLSDIGFSGEIPEDHDTLEENAFQKADYIFDRFQLPCFADDTGLCVDALNGAPGVYSARYAGEHCLPDDNMDKLLGELTNETNRSATFKTVVAFVTPNDRQSFLGEVDGEILTERGGEEGFGYDPVFKPNGFDLSFAQMSKPEKNRISHRGRAVIKFAEYLLKS